MADWPGSEKHDGMALSLLERTRGLPRAGKLSGRRARKHAAETGRSVSGSLKRTQVRKHTNLFGFLFNGRSLYNCCQEPNKIWLTQTDLICTDGRSIRVNTDFRIRMLLIKMSKVDV